LYITMFYKYLAQML